MLNQLHAKLSELERTAVGAIFLLDPNKIDVARSSICEERGFVRCVLRSVSDHSCPFELGFGRGSHQGRMNFFVGEGAEYYNYEECTTPADAAEIAEDMAGFLKSTIACVQQISRGTVSYTADLLVIDGAPIMLRADNVKAPLATGNQTEIEYEPWLPEDA